MRRLYTHFLLRRLHRYLAVVIGIQFLLWTLGGLYFSWSDIDEIHGDHQRRPAPLTALDTPACAFVAPGIILEQLRASGARPDSLISLRLIPVLDRVCWQIVYLEKNAQGRRPRHTRLADACTGALRPPLTREEAVEAARRQFAGQPQTVSVEYLEQTSPDHEYRENALPAWAVTFEHPSRTTVYVAAEAGTVEKFRNAKWRVFDWFWMLHVMDYETRDNIGNWLLRLFSVLGLVTVFSGYALFWVSSRRRRH